MVEANIDFKNSTVLCPTCNKANFSIFRKDGISQGLYLHHCRCKECGQLFVYKIDKVGKYILEGL